MDVTVAGLDLVGRVLGTRSAKVEEVIDDINDRDRQRNRDDATSEEVLT